MTGDADDDTTGASDGGSDASGGSRRRLVAGVALLAALLVLAGCSSPLGPGPVQEGELAAEPGDSYDWSRSVDGYLEVNENNYTAVYRVANRTTGSTEAGENFSMELYTRDALGTDQPLDPTALQFRYENGTRLRYQERDDNVSLVMVRNGTATDVPDEKLAVSKSRRRTTVQLPTNQSGKLAFTAPKNGKQVATPTFIEGSYEMLLPAGGRIGLPVLAQVQPSRSSAERTGGRVLVQWDSVARAQSVLVRYYLERDLFIFGGLVALMLLVGTAGAAYYYLQIRETVKRREEVGLDVDIDDDDGRDPPPGMG